METITVGLWATNIEPPAASLAAWAALVETRMAEAQAAGAELLVLPEFACAQWLGFAPVGLPLDQQVPWLASLTEPALAALGPLPARYGVALLAGTMPTAVPDPDGGPLRHVNRAWLMTRKAACTARTSCASRPASRTRTHGSWPPARR